MPAQVGAVVIGDGTRFKTRFVRDEAQGKRLAQTWKTRSQQPGGGGTYEAQVVAVYDDGTVQNNHAAAKTWLTQQPIDTLIRPGITSTIAQKIRAA